MSNKVGVAKAVSGGQTAGNCGKGCCACTHGVTPSTMRPAMVAICRQERRGVLEVRFGRVGVFIMVVLAGGGDGD